MKLAAVLFAASIASGCAATVSEIRHHPQQARLERLLAEVLPHTKYPHKHYWLRVSDPGKDRIGLAVLPQRHIYIAQEVVDNADDAILRALLVHGVAHHRLHHHTERAVADVAQGAAFKAGGQFVPGLSNAGHIGGPVAERVMSPVQEWSGQRKALAYLHRMNVPAEDYARALEFLADHNYSERMGGLTHRANSLRRRAAKVRKHAAKHAPPASR